MSLKSRIEGWFYGMGQCIIGGAAAAGSAWMGLSMAKSVGMDVPVLNWKSLGMILLTSSLSNLFFFLKQSPLPPKSDGDTVIINKSDIEKTNEKTNP